MKQLSLVQLETYTYRQTVFEIVLLGSIFLLQFSAYLSYLNLISQIYAQEDFKSLGNVAIFTLYGSFAMGSLIATNFAQKFPYKWVMFVCSIGVTFYVSQGLYISGCAIIRDKYHDDVSWICTREAIYSIVVLIGLVCGFFDATLWISQSGYLDALCARYPERTGLFFGTFWSLMESSQVIGMLIATPVLKYAGQFNYFLTMTCLSAFSSLMFLFLPNVPHKTSIMIEKISLKKTLVSVYRLLTANTKSVYPQFVYFAFGGVIIAFYSGIFHTIIEDSLDIPAGDEKYRQSYVNVHTTYIFLALGVAEIATGLISGTLNSKFSVHTLMKGQVMIALLALTLSFINYYVNSYPLCFVCGVLFGVSDCAYMNLSCVSCSKDFRGRLESFSLFKFFQGICVAIILILNICLPPLTPILSICTVLNVITLAICFRLSSPTEDEALQWREDSYELKYSQEYDIQPTSSQSGKSW